MKPAAPTYFPALTGLRALMAWDVFIFHYHLLLPGPFSAEQFVNGGGDMGVSMFFVLSGFLIAHKYAGTRFSAAALKEYFVKRFARIYPLFFLISGSCIVVFRFILHAPRDYSAWALFLHFTLLKGFWENHNSDYLAPTWSLAVEEFFYVLAPLLFLLLPRVRIFVQCTIVMLTGLLIAGISTKLGSTDFMHHLNFTLQTSLFGRIFQFGAGIWLSRLLAQKDLATKRSFGITFAGLAAVMLMQTMVPAMYAWWLGPFQGLPYILFIDFAMPAGICLLFYGLITETTWLRRLLETPLMQLCGRSSFAFYLLHNCVFITSLLITRLQASGIVCFLVIGVISAGMYLGIEHPVHLLLVRWWRKHNKAAPVLLQQDS